MRPGAPDEILPLANELVRLKVDVIQAGTIAVKILKGTPPGDIPVERSLSSGKSRNRPVMFPPGRASITAKPAAMGSVSRSTATMGMLVVALAAAFTPAGAMAPPKLEAQRLRRGLRGLHIRRPSGRIPQ